MKTKWLPPQFVLDAQYAIRQTNYGTAERRLYDEMRERKHPSGSEMELRSIITVIERKDYGDAHRMLQDFGCKYGKDFTNYVGVLPDGTQSK